MPTTQTPYAAEAKTFQGSPCKRGHNGMRYLRNNGCVQCSKMHNKKRVADNPEQTKAYQRQWKQTNKKKVMLSAAYQRAKEGDKEFSLLLADIVIPETCPVFGTPMVSPSLDRVNNSEGYTKRNTRVISDRANRLKRDATLDELKALVAYMEREAQAET